MTFPTPSASHEHPKEPRTCRSKTPDLSTTPGIVNGVFHIDIRIVQQDCQEETYCYDNGTFDKEFHSAEQNG